MVDTARHTKTAKDIIKNRFGVDIEVEFVTHEKAPKRKAEIAEQYGSQVEKLGGFFMPEANGLAPIMLVAYKDNDQFDFIETYYHELQHAIDFYEAQARLGKETLEAIPYFSYYTEYNASFHGALRYTIAVLDSLSTDTERRQFMADSKAQCVRAFNKIDRITIIDILFYMARVSAFARIEGGIDYSLVAGIPQREKFAEIVNHINKYEPTQEWYAEFKKRVDGLTVKE